VTNTFHNQSSAYLADAYGTLDAQIKALTKQADAIKGELKARKIDTVEGAKFTVSVASVTSKRLDTAALKKALGDDIIAEFERDQVSDRLTVKATVVFDQSAVAA
jgi:hypothetical protein